MSDGGHDSRGEYGDRRRSLRGVHAPRVGQGSFFHSPTEVDDELRQLHGEIVSFDRETSPLVNRLEAQVVEELKQARDEALAAGRVVDSYLPLVKERDRLQNQIARNPGLMPDLIAAQEALDRFMHPTARRAAMERARALQRRLGELERRRMGELPLLTWVQRAWKPFYDNWRVFYEQKTEVPAQTWPLTGTWDRIQEYRRQFIDLRNKAPFKAQGPTPLDPTARTDPNLTGGLRDLWGGAGNVFGIVKWGLIGALGIGAVVALSSVVSNVRKGKDPGEKYVEMIRGRRSRASSRALPPPRERLALPPSSEEDT